MTGAKDHRAARCFFSYQTGSFDQKRHHHFRQLNWRTFFQKWVSFKEPYQTAGLPKCKPIPQIHVRPGLTYHTDPPMRAGLFISPRKKSRSRPLFPRSAPFWSAPFCPVQKSNPPEGDRKRNPAEGCGVSSSGDLQAQLLRLLGLNGALPALRHMLRPQLPHAPARASGKHARSTKATRLESKRLQKLRCWSCSQLVSHHTKSLTAAAASQHNRLFFPSPPTPLHLFFASCLMPMMPPPHRLFTSTLSLNCALKLPGYRGNHGSHAKLFESEVRPDSCASCAVPCCAMPALCYAGSVLQSCP